MQDLVKYVSLFSFIYIILGFFVGLIILCMLIDFVRAVVVTFKSSKQKRLFKNNVTVYEQTKYKDLDKAKLNLLNNPNIDDLKDYFYDIFLRFETAYNRLDYGMMRNLSTSKLYQNYYLLISLDLKKGNKKVIDNIKRENVIIYDVMSTSYNQTIFTMIEISYINYTIDKAGNIISGNRNYSEKECFEVVFKKALDSNSVVKCPNCGANVNNNKCEYCRTIIKDEEYKIYSIQKVVK